MPECKLYESAVFGPIDSRRLGRSLGINLLPGDIKVCNYNCVYCECGWTDLKYKAKARFPTRNEICESLVKILRQLRFTGEVPDSITFAGNGEPTLHPEFHKIVEEVIEIRNELSPESSVCVFSNGTLLNKKEILYAMKKVDMRILKFDAGSEEDYQKIDKPIIRRSVEWIKNHLSCFNGDLIIQSMFLQGYHEGEFVSNITESSIKSWLRDIEDIRPELVMIYSVDRPTAAPGIERVGTGKLREIAEKAERLGIRTQVS